VARILATDEADCPFAPETRRRVREVAGRLKYRPNSSASSLRSGWTHTVALAIPSFQTVRGPIQIANLQGIGEQAQKLGYALTLCGYEEHSNLRMTFERLVREGRFDGVLIYSHKFPFGNSTADEREAVFAELKIPFVSLERTTPDAPCIDFDNVHGGREATEHLIRLGRRRIAFLGHSEKGIPYRDRYRGYADAMAAGGLEVDRRWAEPLEGDFAQTGRRGARRLLESGADFDALVCVTDVTAMAAMQVLAERGVHVPKEVAVVGYDDSPMALLAAPALTTVRQDGREMGRQAMTMLHEQMESGDLRPVRRLLKPSLVVRRSCGGSAVCAHPNERSA
jgi:LacI family transcriptional regulator